MVVVDKLPDGATITRLRLLWLINGALKQAGENTITNTRFSVDMGYTPVMLKHGEGGSLDATMLIKDAKFIAALQPLDICCAVVQILEEMEQGS